MNHFLLRKYKCSYAASTSWGMKVDLNKDASQNNICGAAICLKDYFPLHSFDVTDILFLNLSLKYAQVWGNDREHREEKNNKTKVHGVNGWSRFSINPLWLTSIVEIKAVICLKRLNNVKHSVKHTPVALYIMRHRTAEGRLWKDNTTYPSFWETRRERRREREETKRYLERKRDRGGNERVSNKDLTRVYHLQYVVD